MHTVGWQLLLWELPRFFPSNAVLKDVVIIQIPDDFFLFVLWIGTYVTVNFAYLPAFSVICD